MDLSNSTVKTPDAETENPTPTRIQIQPVKASPFTNGVLKRHAPLHHHHPIVVSYKECLKNHAAGLGCHAVDGCGEFMPSPTSNPSDPTSLKCAACGCHRNFHRREPEEPLQLPLPPPNATPALEYQPHHRHHPPPPPPRGNSGSSPSNSPSPPPISSSFYPSAPHMLLALSHGLSAPPPDGTGPISGSINQNSGPLVNSGGRKRFRTKFSQEQKEKMLEFAEKVGWKMQKRDEDAITEFCNEIGVDKGVLKVWMHNNKNNSGKKDHQNPQLPDRGSEIPSPPPPAAANGVNYSSVGGGAAYHHPPEENRESKLNVGHHLHDNNLGNNGSSSSS